MASPIPAAYSATTIRRHVDLLKSQDPDLRIMALSDLQNVILNPVREFVYGDGRTTMGIFFALVEIIDGDLGELQNLALQCLGPFEAHISPTEMIRHVSYLIKATPPETARNWDGSLHVMAIRTILASLPGPEHFHDTAARPDRVLETSELICGHLVPNLVDAEIEYDVPSHRRRIPRSPNIFWEKGELLVSSVELISDISDRFGAYLKDGETEALLETLLRCLDRSTDQMTLVRRCYVHSISALASRASAAVFDHLIRRILTILERVNSDAVLRAHLAILASLAKTVPSKFAQYGPEVTLYLVKGLSETKLQKYYELLADGDTSPAFTETAEVTFHALEAIIANCPPKSHAHLEEVVACCLRFLSFDPNSVGNDDDDDDDDDDGLSGKGSDSNMDEDEFDYSDGASEFGDDEDQSWKVRRATLRVLWAMSLNPTVVHILGQESFYRQVTMPVVRRLREQDENVRLYVIALLVVIVGKLSEAEHQTKDESFSAIASGESANVSVLPSRKRRRSSDSGGQFASNQTTAMDISPSPPNPLRFRNELASLWPTVRKRAPELLAHKVIAIRQATIDLFYEILLAHTNAFHGLGDKYLPLILDCLRAKGQSTQQLSSTTSSSGTKYASASIATLRTATLRFLGLLAQCDPVEMGIELDPSSASAKSEFLCRLVESVVGALGDASYKLAVDAIGTVEQIMNALLKTNEPQAYHELIGRTSQLVLKLASSTSTDTDTRKRAMSALGCVLLESLGDAARLEALGREMVGKILRMFHDQLSSETTQVVALEAVYELPSSCRVENAIPADWLIAMVGGTLKLTEGPNQQLRLLSLQVIEKMLSEPLFCGQVDVRQQLLPVLVPGLLQAVQRAADEAAIGVCVETFTSLVRMDALCAAEVEVLRGVFQMIFGSEKKARIDPTLITTLMTFFRVVGESGQSKPLMDLVLAQALEQTTITVADASLLGRLAGILLVHGQAQTGLSLESIHQLLSSPSQRPAQQAFALMALAEVSYATKTIDPSVFISLLDSASLDHQVFVTAMGRAFAGDLDRCIPIVVGLMNDEASEEGRRFAGLRVLQEVIGHVYDDANAPSSSNGPTDRLSSFASVLWENLVRVQATSGFASQGATVVRAACLGRLVVMNPGEYLPRVEAVLRSPSDAQGHDVRALAVEAIRVAVGEGEEGVFERVAFVELLTVMLQDEDLDVRRLGLTTFKTAVAHQPGLVLYDVARLVPFVLTETILREELVQVVRMGPHVHRIDGGLDLRKNAYETLATLIVPASSAGGPAVGSTTGASSTLSGASSTTYHRSALPAMTSLPSTGLMEQVYERLAAGLQDHDDIRTLCGMMLVRLVTEDADRCRPFLATVAAAYTTVLQQDIGRVGTDGSSVQGEVEDRKSAQAGVLRMTAALSKKLAGQGVVTDLVGTATAGEDATAPTTAVGDSVDASGSRSEGVPVAWTRYVQWVRGKFPGSL